MKVVCAAGSEANRVTLAVLYRRCEQIHCDVVSHSNVVEGQRTNWGAVVVMRRTDDVADVARPNRVAGSKDAEVSHSGLFFVLALPVLLLMDR